VQFVAGALLEELEAVGREVPIAGAGEVRIASATWMSVSILGWPAGDAVGTVPLRSRSMSHLAFDV
jgi:hypothetical protein